MKRQAQKFSKMRRQFHTAAKVVVSLDKVKGKKNDPQASIVKYVISLPGRVVVVKSRAVDLYEAVVAATRSGMRQLRKTKERQEDQRRTSH